MTWTLDPARSSLRVWTRKEGLLSKVAHDLCLESRALQLELGGDEASLSATLTVPVASLRVLGQVHADGRVEPLKPKDHAEIEDSLRGPKVLDAGRFPEVRWRGTGQVAGDRLALRGDLTLHGATRPLALGSSWRLEDGAALAQGRVELLQTAWGIKPFSALLGALKVQDGLAVSWELRLVRG